MRWIIILSPGLIEIQHITEQLSYQEHLLLIEYLIHNLQKNINRIDSDKTSINLEELILMANDPQIQKEIKSIEQEFIVTEIDGIEFI